MKQLDDLRRSAPQDIYYPPTHDNYIANGDLVEPPRQSGAGAPGQSFARRWTRYHLLALGLLAASAATNGAGAATTGAGFMGLIAVGISVLSDAAKSSSPLVIRRAMREGAYLLAAGMMALLIVAGSFSASLALTAALGSRTEASAGRTGIEDQRARLKASYDAGQAELASLPATRPVPELNAVISNGAGVDPAIWVRTSHCLSVTLLASQMACKPFADASGELGRAQRRVELEAALKDTSDKLATLPAPKAADGLVLAIQNIATLWGGRPEPATVQLVAALLLVGLLELGSTLMPLAAELMAETHVAAPAHNETRQRAKLPLGAPTGGQVLPDATGLPREVLEGVQPQCSRGYKTATARLQARPPA